jgi:hypothetical protein
MAEYRLFLLDDGARINRVETLDYRDDDEAISAAWRWVGEHKIELWSLGGLVARFSSTTHTQARPG